jgi:hypothetical protein
MPDLEDSKDISLAVPESDLTKVLALHEEKEATVSPQPVDKLFLSGQSPA